MPEPKLDDLETVFPQVVLVIQKEEFDSHEFILQLAHDYQALYVKALAVYADTDGPFQIVHGEIARRLLGHKDLAIKTGDTISSDIFEQQSSCATWRKVK